MPLKKVSIEAGADHTTKNTKSTMGFGREQPTTKNTKLTIGFGQEESTTKNTKDTKSTGVRTGRIYHKEYQGHQEYWGSDMENQPPRTPRAPLVSDKENLPPRTPRALRGSGMENQPPRTPRALGSDREN
jgi:hypothetical protein